MIWTILFEHAATVSFTYAVVLLFLSVLYLERYWLFKFPWRFNRTHGVKRKDKILKCLVAPTKIRHFFLKLALAIFVVVSGTGMFPIFKALLASQFSDVYEGRVIMAQRFVSGRTRSGPTYRYHHSLKTDPLKIAGNKSRVIVDSKRRYAEGELFRFTSYRGEFFEYGDKTHLILVAILLPVVFAGAALLASYFYGVFLCRQILGLKRKVVEKEVEIIEAYSYVNRGRRGVSLWFEASGNLHQLNYTLSSSKCSKERVEDLVGEVIQVRGREMKDLKFGGLSLKRHLSASGIERNPVIFAIESNQIQRLLVNA